ncbi:hypothetical protein TREMEDRAFT_43495 [Tremella mesenterica DSM 1558]|uniref:uncharacterized protein n=1 Tax=Tremella mesenterica (strain ATCC 24925 / CBS 8224 / DSM 1558 / NBRC 9311 / NRRL Y-6157 / RJB 2259-6 / UBC 559-6) TaxID=578456 RepID=UPI0003F49A3E|nr:uncharacterized protein TREMEDRAFT_43495 [Tremella mesenterica DSM 1558]EIW69817.1 hypothetical protein TREMEDRAFT_43495 [Tremella mesenterica DSM 1558]
MSHKPHSMDSYPQLNFEARAKHLNSIYDRLNQFKGGHFNDFNLGALLTTHRLDDPAHISLQVWSAPGHSKPTFEEAKRQTYQPTHKGQSFGPSWTNHWFKVIIHIPPSWEDYERVQIEFDCSGEAMVFNTHGDPYHGLTGGSDQARRIEFIIPAEDRKAGVGHYYIEASCNEMFGQNGMDPPDPNRYYQLGIADLVVPNMEAWRLLWDFDAIHQLVNDLPGDTPLRMKALWVANEMMNVFQVGNVDSISKAREVGKVVLGEKWMEEIELESKHAEKQEGALWGVGHCHIDSAWLWPFSVTQQKAARSWSTQCDLIDRYPEHRFSATQAQQFKWVEDLYPSLFARIKEKVSAGRFQPLGATWVEMDTNMPSGEALCRQFLYGQRYYHSRFGFTSDTFVLPDTFGYSSQLPQIARLAGCINFFTQKLSWNSTNNFPHSTFNWVGIDSSQILTHMTPVNNYNSQCHMSDIRRGMTGHKNLEVTSQALLLFGNGDGGGGPTPPMLEKLRRTRVIGKRHDAGGQIPLLKMGGSFSDFFKSVREETINGTRLPNWRGELYAEFHRGTYTTHGSIKKGNRKSEILMREAEYAATMASLADREYEYPKAKLDKAWEELLLCQFHDVLPGSGIAMIYEDAEIKYAAIQKSITAVLHEAYEILYKGSKELSFDQKDVVYNVFAVNNLPNYPRQAVVEVLLKDTPSLKAISAQVSNDGKTGLVLVDATDTVNPLIGLPKGLYANITPVIAREEADSLFILSSGALEMKLTNGRITSIYDKQADRELIPEGQSAGMVIMEDHPNFWDELTCRDVDQFHLEKQIHLKFNQVHIISTGPLRATLGASIVIGQSHICVEISLDAIPASLAPSSRPMLRFSAIVDWREKHRFLKFELPLTVTSDMASYDTQFGILQRPTHRNTSWDNAKFEVCGHKYADLSEYGYGVALLNESKYGYATEGNVMRLSLLRAPTLPDPECDMGVHEFQWAVLPHLGTLTESDVAQVAYDFNTPMRLRHTPKPIHDIASHALGKASPFSVEHAKNVMLETVKRGEDDMASGKTTIILRLFEQYGGHAKATLRISGLSVSRADLTDILETPTEPLDLVPVHVEGKDEEVLVTLNFRGFEIKTVKLTIGSSKRLSVGSWVDV